MASPIPKPPGQRRRRNAVAGLSTLPATAPLVVPECPSENELVGEWWAMIWRSPMASTWTEGDAPTLMRLAMLWEQFVVKGWGMVHILAIEDRLGLSPMSRRRLGWEISRAAGSAAAAAATGQLPSDDLRLRLVSGSGAP